MPVSKEHTNTEQMLNEPNLSYLPISSTTVVHALNHPTDIKKQ